MTKELAKNLGQEEWYQALVEECRAIIVETVFTSRIELIRGKWLLGDRLWQEKNKGITKLLTRVSVDLRISERECWRCYKFREEYRDFLNKSGEINIEVLPEGKNISWHKIANKYLPQPKEREKIELPEGKYRTLVVDPPWKTEKILREVRPNQVEMDYLLLTAEEIRDFRDKKGKAIPDLFNLNGCHVYLWTTHKHLPDALEILKAWGVKYQCVLTWIKNVGMTPYSWMYSTELVLFGRVGNLDLLKKGERLDFYGKVREHSRKPDEFYELVKKVSPAPRIDVFSREKREGFDQYGNEPNKFKNR